MTQETKEEILKVVSDIEYAAQMWDEGGSTISNKFWDQLKDILEKEVTDKPA